MDTGAAHDTVGGCLSTSAADPVRGSELANPRKRKKASRACDFCHVNHQPCDNGKPRCSVCAKHSAPCSYLRPTKRRGPQKGYRTALNSYKESAATWGAVLSSMPGLDGLILGHLRGPAGAETMAMVKDPSQQDALIAKWQSSDVFRVLVGDGAATAASPASAGVVSSALDMDKDDDVVDAPPTTRSPAKRRSLSRATGSAATGLTAPSSPRKKTAPSQLREATSLSDILARDTARSAVSASQFLGPLGFAENETFKDLYDIGANPDLITDPPGHDYEADLAKVYYHLGMGGRFSG